MKRLYQLINVIVLLPLLMGMSNLGGESPARIPVPEKKFKAAFIDQTDTYTDVSEASIDGHAFLAGKKGEGNYTVAFENIHYIDYLMKNDILIAQIQMRDGAVLSLTVKKNSHAFGKTSYGTFQIRLADLKRMTILGPQK